MSLWIFTRSLKACLAFVYVSFNVCLWRVTLLDWMGLKIPVGLLVPENQSDRAYAGCVQSRRANARQGDLETAYNTLPTYKT